MRKASYTIVSALCLIGLGYLSFTFKTKKEAPYKDASLPVSKRLADLMGRMTLEEKVAQVQCIWLDKKKFMDETGNFLPNKAKQVCPLGMGHIGRPSEGIEGGGGLGRTPEENARFSNSVQKFFVEETRLGIPVLFHEECLHGHAALYGTSFPQPIGLASTWDIALVEQLFTMTAAEARSRGTHVVLTPVVDISRDPRWGRVEETYGEDPYLVSQMGLAAVYGFQGRNGLVDGNHVMATLKHFVGHGQPEGGNNVAPANVTERDLRENHMYPFKIAVQHGKVKNIMASYNEVNGVPSHNNNWLLNDVLRKEWGFKGVVVSDYYGVEEIYLRHKVAEDLSKAAVQAMKSGVDMELPDPKAFVLLTKAFKEGIAPTSVLDSAVSRILRQKFELGLFENPYADPRKAAVTVATSENIALARKAAEETMVLLKNEGNILPLKMDKYKTIAVIGPNADKILLGGYSDRPTKVVTVLEGIKNKLSGNATILYSEGCKITHSGSWYKDEVKLVGEQENAPLIKEAVEVAKKADIVLLVVGDNELLTREAWAESHLGDRTNLDLTKSQEELISQIAALNKPIVSLLFNGKPMSVTSLLQKSDALLECWYLGQEAGNAVANVLVGEVNPSGKLPISFPRSAGHIPSYYNHKPTARRGYHFDEATPLFAFGYGLSYTKFDISQPTIAKNEIPNGSSTSVSVTITNKGNVEGKEVVQFRDMYSSVTRPVKELKAFEKVSLKPGESKKITFEITPEMLSFYNDQMKYGVEPGEFEIYIGNSSRKEDLKTVKLKVL